MHHLENEELVLRESFINDIEMIHTEILDYDQYFFLFSWEEIPRNSETDGKGKGDAASRKRSVSLGK